VRKWIAILVFSTSIAFASDYSGKSLEEMKALRPTLSFWELPAFKTEMQKRMKNMTPEERQKLHDTMMKETKK